MFNCLTVIKRNLTVIKRNNRHKSLRNYKFYTFLFVSNDPNPQNVPPPVAVPPTLSNTLSDSTYKN